MSENALALVLDGLDTPMGAARFLGMGRTTIYGLMERGELPYVRIGDGRRIPRRALVEFAASRLVIRNDAVTASAPNRQ